MVAECVNREFFQIQAKMIRTCIEEDKWYLSEEVHSDIGWDRAEQHFLQRYMPGFAAGFRATYCGLLCPYRQGCEIGRHYAVGGPQKQGEAA